MSPGGGHSVKQSRKRCQGVADLSVLRPRSQGKRRNVSWSPKWKAMCADGVDIRQDKFRRKSPLAAFNYPPRKTPRELIWSLGTLSLRLTPKGDGWSSCPTRRGCGWVEEFHSRSLTQVECQALGGHGLCRQRLPIQLSFLYPRHMVPLASSRDPS